MKLIDILLESLKEARPITLDKSVFSQIETLYSKYMSLDPKKQQSLNNEDSPLKLGSINYKHPYKDVSVNTDIFAVNSPDKPGAFLTKSDGSISVNYTDPLNKKKPNFVNAIYHELVHAVDPKITNKKIYDKLHNKTISKIKSDATSNPYIQYLKNPTEFDAWSSSFINQISNILDGIESEDTKKEIKKLIKDLIQDLLRIQKEVNPSHIGSVDPLSMFSGYTVDFDISNLLDKYVSSLGDYLFGDKDSDMALTFVVNLIQYLNKPSQFKKYIQRLSALL